MQPHSPNEDLCPIDQLVPYKNNARTHSPEQVEQIARSIERFGFNNPVLVGDDSVIITGHGRVLAARQLGIGEVPVRVLSHLNEEERRAYVLADNKLALNAGWDEELLAIELGELADLEFDLKLTGFTATEFDLALSFAEETSGDQTDPNDRIIEPLADPVI